MLDQSTSGTTAAQPTSAGVAKQLGRQVEDASRKYRGGTDRAQLALGHPQFSEQLYDLLDKLADEQALRLPLLKRPVWMILQRTCTDARAYTADLKEAGFRIGDWAVDIMKKPGFKQGFDIDSVNLVSATGMELTGKAEPTTAEIFQGIRKANGELCPPWVGPELRKQYPDQPAGEVIIVAMETITGSGGFSYLFRVHRVDNDRWLNADWGDPGRHWFGSDRWVFRRK